MGARASLFALFPAVFAGLLVVHLPFLHLPYFWDEAGYYIPAAWDFYRHGLLIPRSTVPSGHTPLVTVYLGMVWRLFGFSELATRAAMLLVAAATVVASYRLGCYVAGRETGRWGALLLALSPLFFAQSSLVFLDLATACFTGFAVLFLLEERWLLFALSSTGAVMSKETAVVMLPVMWGFMLLRRREQRLMAWAALLMPLVPLGAWVLYYHHQTGFWTGNPQYLQYNVYSALAPLHILRSLVARTCEVFVQGFNGLLTAGAVVGIWLARKRRYPGTIWNGVQAPAKAARVWSDFKALAIALILAYILMLSLVGGAVLSRYMLPVLPLFIILTLGLMRHLPGFVRHASGLMVAACFVLAWFINPPYPFPYENNLSYVDFIRLHQEAASYLESLPGDPVILTAWPATDELRQPLLGYVRRPLQVARLESFTVRAFSNPPQYDLLYAYSRKWEPKHNLLEMVRPVRRLLEQFYDYHLPVSIHELAAQRHLKLLKLYERRGQWVRIYDRK